MKVKSKVWVVEVWVVEVWVVEVWVVEICRNLEIWKYEIWKYEIWKREKTNLENWLRLAVLNFQISAFSKLGFRVSRFAFPDSCFRIVEISQLHSWHVTTKLLREIFQSYLR